MFVPNGNPNPLQELVIPDNPPLEPVLPITPPNVVPLAPALPVGVPALPVVSPTPVPPEPTWSGDTAEVLKSLIENLLLNFSTGACGSPFRKRFYYKTTANKGMSVGNVVNSLLKQ